MNRPFLLAIPILMLTDYGLTIVSARLREQRYAEHFRIAHFELNPIWQRAVAKKRRFNSVHLLIVAVITAGIVWLDHVVPPYWTGFDVLVGVLFVVLGTVVGRHVSNLAIFAWVRRDAGAIDGTVTLSHAFVLWLSASQLAMVLLPLGLLAAFKPLPLILGAALGALLLFCLHGLWLLVHRYRRRNTESR